MQLQKLFQRTAVASPGGVDEVRVVDASHPISWRHLHDSNGDLLSGETVELVDEVRERVTTREQAIRARRHRPIAHTTSSISRDRVLMFGAACCGGGAEVKSLPDGASVFVRALRFGSGECRVVF